MRLGRLGKLVNPPAPTFVALFLPRDPHFAFPGGVMATRVRGWKRSLSKKVSGFNMYDDQVYQIRAIMESSGEHKDAPVIRELLDEALRARRRKALVPMMNRL